MTLELRSSAFMEGEAIPEKYTCDGQDISPPLEWTDVPEGARSLVLLCDDPDSARNPWSHWVLYDLPAGASGVPEGYPPGELPGPGGKQGRNDFGDVQYGGPCPGGGQTHRYSFLLYALDETTGLSPGAIRVEILERMQGHILAQAALMGRYKRRMRAS
jgi:Raf kinase inhibitor-like YbhB/YbcL family protein